MYCQPQTSGSQTLAGRCSMTRPLFLYQSKLEFLGINSPFVLVSCGFRALQRLHEEALECAPHQWTSFSCHTPMELCKCRRRAIGQRAVRSLVIVMLAELGQLLPRIRQRNEPLHVQTFVS